MLSRSRGTLLKCGTSGREYDGGQPSVRLHQLTDSSQPQHAWRTNGKNKEGTFQE